MSSELLDCSRFHCEHQQYVNSRVGSSYIVQFAVYSCGCVHVLTMSMLAVLSDVVVWSSLCPLVAGMRDRGAGINSGQLWLPNVMNISQGLSDPSCIQHAGIEMLWTIYELQLGLGTMLFCFCIEAWTKWSTFSNASSWRNFWSSFHWNFFLQIDSKSLLVLIMTWHQMGNKHLPNPVLTQSIDAYLYHQALMS